MHLADKDATADRIVVPGAMATALHSPSLTVFLSNTASLSLFLSFLFLMLVVFFLVFSVFLPPAHLFCPSPCSSVPMCLYFIAIENKLLALKGFPKCALFEPHLLLIACPVSVEERRLRCHCCPLDRLTVSHRGLAFH